MPENDVITFFALPIGLLICLGIVFLGLMALALRRWILGRRLRKRHDIEMQVRMNQALPVKSTDSRSNSVEMRPLEANFLDKNSKDLQPSIEATPSPERRLQKQVTRHHRSSSLNRLQQQQLSLPHQATNTNAL